MNQRLTFIFLVCTLAFNQYSSAQRFRAGLIGGLVATEVAGVDQMDFDNDFNKAGFIGGGLLNAKISDKNSFQFEIYYVQKGSWQHKSDTAGNLVYYYSLKLNYIEVPLIYRHQMHIQVHSKSNDNFSFEFGPSFGALINVKQNGLFYQDGQYISGYFDNSDFRKTEFSLHAGISYTFFKNFIFDVRYSNSIVPVTKHREVFGPFFRYTFNKGDNMAFSFTIRYVFLKQKKTE